MKRFILGFLNKFYSFLGWRVDQYFAFFTALIFAGTISFIIFALVTGKFKPTCTCVRETCHDDIVLFPDGNGNIFPLPMQTCTCDRCIPFDAGINGTIK